MTLLMLPTSNFAHAQGVILTPEDNVAKQKILANLSNAVDHGFDKYDLLIASVKGDNSTFTIYNKSETEPPLVCGPGTHEQDGVCVPDPQQTCQKGQFFNTTSQRCEDLPSTLEEICGDGVDNDAREVETRLRYSSLETFWEPERLSQWTRETLTITSL
jgi:hypothetical protein